MVNHRVYYALTGNFLSSFFSHFFLLLFFFFFFFFFFPSFFFFFFFLVGGGGGVVCFRFVVVIVLAHKKKYIYKKNAGFCCCFCWVFCLFVVFCFVFNNIFLFHWPTKVTQQTLDKVNQAQSKRLLALNKTSGGSGGCGVRVAAT